ncbi:MAG TPA: nuclear transport factor 2 family protein [Longimicrobiales bacterium]
MAHARAALEGLLDAIEARDMQAVLDSLADDVTLEVEALATPIRGKPLLRDMLAGTMDAYDSVRIERRKIVESGRDVAALLGAHVKLGRDMEMLGETLPTAGKELDVRGAVFAEVDDAGKIKRLMRVRDTLGVVQQLGLSPERMRALVEKFEEQVKQQRRAA